MATAPIDFGVLQLAGLLEENGTDKPVVLDVREPQEFEIARLDGALLIPMGEIPGRVGELPRDRHLVVMCHHGGRSMRVVQWLRAQGWDNVSNLSGGIDAWAADVDPSMARY